MVFTLLRSGLKFFVCGVSILLDSERSGTFGSLDWGCSASAVWHVSVQGNPCHCCWECTWKLNVSLQCVQWRVISWVYIYVCVDRYMRAGACGVGKKVSDPPELWLEAVVGSPLIRILGAQLGSFLRAIVFLTAEPSVSLSDCVEMWLTWLKPWRGCLPLLFTLWENLIPTECVCMHAYVGFVCLVGWFLVLVLFCF